MRYEMVYTSKGNLLHQDFAHQALVMEHSVHRSNLALS